MSHKTSLRASRSTKLINSPNPSSPKFSLLLTFYSIWSLSADRCSWKFKNQETFKESCQNRNSEGQSEIDDVITELMHSNAMCDHRTYRWIGHPSKEHVTVTEIRFRYWATEIYMFISHYLYKFILRPRNSLSIKTCPRINVKLHLTHLSTAECLMSLHQTRRDGNQDLYSESCG